MADKSFKPPEAVASNAARGLEMRKRVKAGTEVGVARARQLSNRQPVSLETIGRMVSYFARHGAQRPADEGTEAKPTPWLVAWMLWGGDAGRRWANGIWKREGRTEASRNTSEASTMDTPIGVMLMVERADDFPAGEREHAPHVTPLYALVCADDAKRAAELVEAEALASLPLAVEYGDLDHFDHGERSVCVVTIGGDAIHALRANMLRALTEAGVRYELTHGGEFRPHATIGYLPAGDRLDVAPPLGADVCKAGEVLCADESRDLGAQRVEASRGPVVEWAKRDMPEGTRLVNPKALRVGTPFRTLTADEAVRSERDGQLLGRMPEDVLAEMVRVFYMQADLGEGAPRINYNHGPSRNGLPDIYGEVVGLFVAQDERGAGLYVVPGWTRHGAAFVEKHETPDGGSVLSNSPEFSIGPIYARGGGESDDDATLLGGAAFLGVALTGTPQQQERIIDPVALSRPGETTAPGPEESGMDAEKRPDGGAERLDAVEAALAALNGKIDALMERVGEAESEAEVDAEMSVEGSDALALAVAQAEDSMSAEQRAELSRRISEDDAKALAGADGAVKAQALSRKLTLVGEVKAADRITELSRQVDALTKASNTAKVDAERARLRGMGGSAERVERIVSLLSRKLAQPTAWAAVHGDACPYDLAVADLKARPDVEMGRRGVNADPETAAVVHNIAAVQAWAAENKVEGRPVAKAKAYAQAKGIKIEEVIQ